MLSGPLFQNETIEFSPVLEPGRPVAAFAAQILGQMLSPRAPDLRLAERYLVQVRPGRLHEVKA
jgi:hypothetical protein